MTTHVFAQFTAFGTIVAFALVDAAISARVAAPIARDAAHAIGSLSKRVRIDHKYSSFEL